MTPTRQREAEIRALVGEWPRCLTAGIVEDCGLSIADTMLLDGGLREAVLIIDAERTRADAAEATLVELREAVLIERQARRDAWDSRERGDTSDEDLRLVVAAGRAFDDVSWLCSQACDTLNRVTAHIRGEVLREAADAMRADTSLPFDTRDGADWLRSRADEAVER